MVLVLSLFLFLVAVAFFTLLERKVLGFIMLRVGPNKPSLLGFFVPFADALKLLSKGSVTPIASCGKAMALACFLLFLLPSLYWCFIELYSVVHNFSLTLLCLLVLISFSIFGLLLCGWGSNSKYAILGSTRCVAQCISYEVCFSLLFLCFGVFKGLQIFRDSGF